MKTGFSYRGRHSREFKYLTMLTQKRPVMPSVKRLTFEPLAADGVLDLSANNEKGRVLYDERVFTLNLMIEATDILQLQYRISGICGWLSGEGELAFDDLPGVVWRAKITDSIEFAPEINGRKAVLSVNFITEPFAHGMFNTADGVPVGSKIPIGTKIPIGLSRSLTVTLAASVQEITVYNVGSAPVSPRITIVHNTAAAANFGAALGNRSVSVWYGYPNITTVVIDMESCEITLGNNAALPADGFRFFELAPGENKITITAARGDAVTVSYTPRFIYGWGCS